jgi:hypothetical protein
VPQDPVEEPPLRELQEVLDRRGRVRGKQRDRDVAAIRLDDRGDERRDEEPLRARDAGVEEALCPRLVDRRRLHRFDAVFLKQLLRALS